MPTKSVAQRAAKRARAYNPKTGRYNTRSGKAPWNPSHEPTKQSRLLVKMLIIGGYSHARIGEAVGCNDKTLRKYYRNEIDNAKPEADAAVIQSQFLQAVGGPRRDWKQAVPAMTAMYLKCQVGWKEPKQEVGHSGAVVVGSYDASKLAALSLAELKTFEAILARLASGSPAAVGDPGGDSEA